MEYFQDIVCINLKHRPDRRKSAQEVFDKYNIPARFHVVDKHPKGGVYGCFQSHIDIIQEAYNKGLDNVLVFEDDLIPTKAFTQDNLERATVFMSTNDKWDIFYLGHFVFYGNFMNAPMVAPNIIRYNPYSAHALCYSKRAMEKILAKYRKYIGITHFDIFLSSHGNLRNYCYVPILFDQMFCLSSDIESRRLMETVARQFQCQVEKNKLFYRVSYIKYFVDTYKTVISVITTLAFIFLILILRKRNVV